jgi:beta-lactam-binding protein with PASTA domain/tRNA A-37 threonylcarbamoyl transferase component Bud32
MTQPRLLGGRYELDGVVGRGGMAEVYRARDIRLDRIVAIKTLRTDLARDQTFQARFRREAQSAASLNHPSIVAVYDTGEDMTSGVPVPYIVMEYVDGRTVRDLLQEGHRLLPERSLEIIDGVLRALEYSHQAGIVHRDIKPGNVMVTRNGDIKVMDFGIARAMSDAQATMTQTAQVIGTAQYLSPEQARGERVDARSDLYSAGCLLYELLTGRPPFTGDSPVAIAYQHVRENPIPPSRIDPDIPRWADAVVLKAMAKAPADRYQSAAEMRADLQRAAQGMPVSAVAPPTRMDVYGPGTQRMGADTMMAGGATTRIPPVDYGDYGDDGYGRGGYDRGGRNYRWVAWVVGLLLVAGVVGGVAYYLLGSSQSYYVPQVAGLSQSAAEKAIKANHLQVTVVSQANSSVTKGLVIGTNPAQGSSVAENSTVTLEVSSGVGKVSVPNVVGQQVTAAESALTAKNLSYQTKANATCTQTANQVLSQDPAAGTGVSPNSTVVLTYCGGGTPVPNVVGLTLQSAETSLQSAGFSYTVETTAGQAGTTPGTVWQQNPQAISTQAPNTKITLLVQPAAASPSPSPSASGTGLSSAPPTPAAGGSPNAGLLPPPLTPGGRG